LLRQLDPNALLIQTDTELLAGVIGGEAKHLAGPHMRVARKQVIKNGFVFRVEIGHYVLL
jgi:hypothetical protein